jgi:hypothetical protein
VPVGLLLEKVGCDHAKAVIQPEFALSADDMKYPSAKASALMVNFTPMYG